MLYTQPLARLIESFQQLPGIGPKSAQRLAFYVLKQSVADVEQFSRALVEAKQRIGSCHTCFNLSCQDPCELCQNEARDKTVLCVVAEPRDLFAVEKTESYRGLYHVLTGLISPLEGIGPQDLTLEALQQRLATASPAIQEVILALPPSVEGDTTSLYLSKILATAPVRLSRIAFGLPVGGDLEYADALTLTRALSGRHAL